MAKMLLATDNEETIAAVDLCLRGTSHRYWTLWEPIRLDAVLRAIVNPVHVWIYDDATRGSTLTVSLQDTYGEPIVKVGLVGDETPLREHWFPSVGGPRDLLSAIDEVLRIESVGGGARIDSSPQLWWAFRSHYAQ